ncbi:MAG: ACP phosphodiesterase [Wenzhouxiangellaceae bacterium]|nr:ACP phosphodiesterase [Wenzhouxiangellaceae bacterium]
MNHLAHLVLAGDDPELQFGALLADHVRGREILATLPPGIAAGVRLHRSIDVWTDRHPVVRELLESLQRPWRRYAGIILDVLFDHMLDRHWTRFGPRSITHFAGQVDRHLQQRQALMPPRMQRFTGWAREVGLWCRYGERAMLERIFELLARRHGRREPLARGLELLDQLEPAIEQAFLDLMPTLRERAELARDPATSGTCARNSS